MDEFLRFIVQQLAEYPDEAVVTRREEGDRIIFQLKLRKSDVGRLIGKGGHTINAIRELLNAAAEKQGKKTSLDVLD